MNKTFKRVLSVFLCILMAISTAAYTFAASDIIATPQYFLSTTDAENAKVVLDKVDEVLKEQDIYIDLGQYSSLLKKYSVDLRSVDGICSTIDNFEGIIKAAKLDLTGAILGDLTDISVKNWTKGMKRGTTADITILKNIIQLLSDNASLIAKIVDGSINLGVLKNAVDLNSLLGADGIYGIIKGAIVGLIYSDENSAEYKAAYAKKLDTFVYEDVIGSVSKAGGALPGFTMNANSTVDNLLISALASAWDKYIVPALKSINIDWSNSDNAALKELSTKLNLNGSTYDFSTVSIDTSKKFADQINNILGAVIKLFYSKANWTNGGVDKLADNLETLYKDLAADMGVKADPIEIVKYVLSNLNVEAANDYISGFESWTSMENAVVAVLKNTAAKQGITVTTKKNATYEEILGDYLTTAVENVVPLSYKAGSGTNVWTVLNDIANVYLFDKGFAKAFNLPSSVTKNSTIFEKLDAVINMTGIFNGLTTASSYKSEDFISGLLDAIFSFDIAKAVDMTAVTFLSDFGDKVAIKVVYDAVYTFLKSWFGKEIIVAYSGSTPVDNAIQNSSLKTTVKNLLTALNSNKDNLLPPVLYIGALALQYNKLVLFSDTDITIANQTYTGKAIVPATITAKGTTLTLGTDFEYTSIANNTKVGTVKDVAIKFIGKYSGEATGLSFKIVLSAPKISKVSSITDTKATVAWSKATGASKYRVSYSTDGKTWTKKDVTATSLTLTGLKANTTYQVKVANVNADGATAFSAVTKFTTNVTQVKGLKVASVTDTTAKLTWTKVAGAKTYNVSYSTNGKKWTTTSVSTNSATISKLSANTTYQFKVAGVNSSKVAGTASAVVKATTKLAKVTGVKVTTTSTTAKVTWTKVAGAKTYNVYYSTDGKKWTKVSASTNSSTIQKLTANTAYQFKVEAVNSSKVAGPVSAVVKASTAVAKVTGLKATKTTKNSVTLKWTQVKGATGYEVYRNNKKVATIKKGATVTYTDSKLKANTTYKYTVKAYKTVSKKNVTGDASATVSAKTTKK